MPFFFFDAHQHADTANNQQSANAAEQESAEATGNGEVEALAVDDGDFHTPVVAPLAFSPFWVPITLALLSFFIFCLVKLFLLWHWLHVW